jgi:predicted RNase H-like nuclease (RuvC/YqgF family)
MLSLGQTHEISNLRDENAALKKLLLAAELKIERNEIRHSHVNSLNRKLDKLKLEIKELKGKLPPT